MKSASSQRPSIEIDHKDIKGLIPAMTMEFFVKDRSLLENITTGDRIEFTVENGGGGLKIIEVNNQ